MWAFTMQLEQNELLNVKINKLTCLSKIIKNGRLYYLCACDCGNEKVIRADCLLNNHTTSCGNCPNLYDLTNEYGIGYTSKNEPFYFDLEDYDKIKDFKWHISKEGYVRTQVNHERIYLHRLVMDAKKDDYIDHINHNTVNNIKSNLRKCTQQENMRNRNVSKSSKSNVLGVYWAEERQKWLVQIQLSENKKISLGRYKNFDEAVKVRKEAEIKYFGEFAPITNIKSEEQTLAN
jgi:hypothetical protein